MYKSCLPLHVTYIRQSGQIQLARWMMWRKPKRAKRREIVPVRPSTHLPSSSQGVRETGRRFSNAQDHVFSGVDYIYMNI